MIGLQTPATPPCAPGSGSGFTYIIIPRQIIIFEPGPPGGDYNSFHSCISGTVTAGETATCTYSCK
jgi:hypothetical protein